MYINDYEVYAGSIKIGKIVMNNEVLYEANSSGDIIIDVTDYSVILGSTISVIYELKGSVTEEQISVIYDDTMFTKNGNDFTVIGEGYSEIIYCIDNKPKQTIRVATAWSNDIILDFSQSSVMPEFPSNITYNLKTGSYGFSLTQYAGGGYGLVSGNKNVNSSIASGYLKLDLSNIEGTFSIRVTYSYQTENITFDYGSLYLSTSSSSYSGLFLKAGGSTAVNNAVVTSPEKNAGIYYLHFTYSKDSSTSTGYDAFCIHKIELLGAGLEYPITYIEFDSDNILCKTGDSISPSILPYNATEEITYTYDSQFIEEIGNNIICKKSGNTSLTVSSKYVNKSINLVIEPAYISDIILESSLNLDDTIYEGDSFTITPSTVPLYHDDELICEYDNYYLNKVGNTFEILETAMGKTLTITYRGLNVYKEYTFSVSDKPGFYIEYTVVNDNYVLNNYSSGSVRRYFCFPAIYSDSNNFSYNGYTRLEITLLDGTILTDNDYSVTTYNSSVKGEDVKKIRLWYPEDTYGIKFEGTSGLYGQIKTIDRINNMNFRSYEDFIQDQPYLTYMCPLLKNNVIIEKSFSAYSCTNLLSLDISALFYTDIITDLSGMCNQLNSLASVKLPDFSQCNNITKTGAMFWYDSKLTSIDLSKLNTSKVSDSKYMLHGVSSSCNIYVGPNWTLTESQTGFSGTFTRV